MAEDRRYVLTTPGHGWENLSVNLNTLGLDELKATSVDDALDQLTRLRTYLVALAIPSLANVDIYEHPLKVESLIDNTVASRIARVGVVSKLANNYFGWRYKSNSDTIVRIVMGDDSDSFFVAYARFLARLREDL